MKQLKQFIHMIDLLNGLELDQRQQYIEANEYSIGSAPYAEPYNAAPTTTSDLGQTPGRPQEERLVEQVAPGPDGAGLAASGGDGSLQPGSAESGKPQQKHVTPESAAAQALQHDQMQAIILQEQIENLRQCQQIDINIWRHFQSLLKKNLHNPYLREALMKRAAALHGGQA
jgi:hypothetical protein